MNDEIKNIIEIGDLVIWNSNLAKEEYYEVVEDIDDKLVKIEGLNYIGIVNKSDLSIFKKYDELTYSLTPKGLLYSIINSENTHDLEQITESIIEFLYINKKGIMVHDGELIFINIVYPEDKNK